MRWIHACCCAVTLTVGYQAMAADDAVLRAGVAKVDITPEPGLRMWGYSNRASSATGTLDPLMAKCVVLNVGRELVAIVTLDLGRTPEDALLESIRTRTKTRSGISNLFITASHTHHAPVMESPPGVSNPYAEKVAEQIVEIVAQAASRLEPAEIAVIRGRADFGHNRRKFLPDGRVAMQWRNAEREPTEPVDPEFVMLRLVGQGGKNLAVLFHYACHPVVLGPDNLQYSADFVGPTCAVVEDKLHTTCLFLQGGCGNINPYLDKTPLAEGGLEAMRGMGQALGKSLVEHASKVVGKPPQKPALQYESRQVPIRVRWDLNDPQVRDVLSRAYGPRFDNYLAKTISNNTLRCTLTTVLINGDVALVGMPGEMFVQFQTALKKDSPVANTLLVGYTHGYYGYFPTIRDAAAGGYGGKTATYVEPGAGARLTDEALITLYRMTGGLHDVPRSEDFKLLEYDDVRPKSPAR